MRKRARQPLDPGAGADTIIEMTDLITHSPPGPTEHHRPGVPVPVLVPAAELAEEFLARAVAAALADGDSWTQIGERLGVPTPNASGRG